MVTAIYMASGLSRRYKSNKLLKKINEKELFRYTLENITLSKVNEVIVVTSFTEIINYCKIKNIKYILNKNPGLGQSQSIKLGVGEASNESSFMFFVADQPLLSVDVINKIIDFSVTEPEKIIIPINKGNFKNPRIFPSSFKKQLLNLEGDNGGRELIKSSENSYLTIEIHDSHSFIDIDTAEDLSLVKRILGI